MTLKGSNLEFPTKSPRNKEEQEQEPKKILINQSDVSHDSEEESKESYNASAYYGKPQTNVTKIL